MKTASQTAGRLDTSIFKVNVIELRPSCGRAFAWKDGFKDSMSKKFKIKQKNIRSQSQIISPVGFVFVLESSSSSTM